MEGWSWEGASQHEHRQNLRFSENGRLWATMICLENPRIHSDHYKVSFETLALGVGSFWHTLVWLWRTNVGRSTHLTWRNRLKKAQILQTWRTLRQTWLICASRDKSNRQTELQAAIWVDPTTQCLRVFQHNLNAKKCGTVGLFLGRRSNIPTFIIFGLWKSI